LTRRQIDKLFVAGLIIVEEEKNNLKKNVKNLTNTIKTKLCENNFGFYSYGYSGIVRNEVDYG